MRTRASEEFISPDPASKPKQDAKAFFAPLDGIMGEVRSAQASVVDPIMAWLRSAIPYFEMFPILSTVSTTIWNAYKVYDNYERRSKFGEANLAAKARLASTTTPSNISTAKMALYAYNKVNRGFWTNVSTFFMSLAEDILHLVTVLSGGTAAIATETAAMALSIARGVVSMGRKVKGALKSAFRRRGKHRLENATVLFNNATAGDAVAMKLVTRLLLAGSFGKVKNKIKDAVGAGSDGLETEAEVHEFLATRHTTEQKQAVIRILAKKMKSS